MSGLQKDVPTEGAAGERLDSRLLPVMREGVAAVQLMLFATLKEDFAAGYTDWPAAEIRRFAGCVVSDLFATPPADPEAARFGRERLDMVEAELRKLPLEHPGLLPILTDALRMQVMCDHLEGLNSLPTLLRARVLDILQEDRPLPLPSTFMLAVRRLGVEQGLLHPLRSEEPDA